MNWKNILTITKKEIKMNFNSPIAYIVICIFLLSAGSYFFSLFFLRNDTSLREFFLALPFLFSIIVPAITMKLFSEEVSTGSYELLITLPVSTLEVVLAKLLSAFVFVMLMMLPTLFYGISVSLLGDLEWGATLGGYLGGIFLGFTYASITLMFSAFSKNQVVALLAGIFSCLFFTYLDMIFFIFPEAVVSFFRFFTLNYHFKNIARGVIDLRDIIYFGSVIFITTYVTYIAMKEKLN